jgi:hypothetical protein
VGALAMHEGHEIRTFCCHPHSTSSGKLTDRLLLSPPDEKFDEDKDRLEDRVDYDTERAEDRYDYDRDRVEDFPDDAARWTGRRVQQVEDIPDDVRDEYDDVKDDIEDVPNNVAGWAGRKVGDVERFDDGIDDSYEEGRVEERYDDDRYSMMWGGNGAEI